MKSAAVISIVIAVISVLASYFIVRRVKDRLLKWQTY